MCECLCTTLVNRTYTSWLQWRRSKGGEERQASLEKKKKRATAFQQRIHTYCTLHTQAVTSEPLTWKMYRKELCGLTLSKFWRLKSNVHFAIVCWFTSIALGKKENHLKYNHPTVTLSDTMIAQKQLQTLSAFTLKRCVSCSELLNKRSKKSL